MKISCSILIEQLYLVILTFILTLKRRRAFSITIIAAPVSLNTAIHSVSIPKNIRTNAANFIVMENQVRLGKSPSCDYRSQTPKRATGPFSSGTVLA